MTVKIIPVDCSRPVTALSFDYGIKRIGVAFGQSISSTTRAIAIVKAKDGVPNWDLVANLVNVWKPDFLIVGLPYNLDGSESELVKRASKFANRLNGRFNIPTFGIDETLSSRAAIEKLKEENYMNRYVADVDDRAAQIILETWFAEYNKNASGQRTNNLTRKSPI